MFPARVSACVSIWLIAAAASLAGAATPIPAPQGPVAGTPPSSPEGITKRFMEAFSSADWATCLSLVDGDVINTYRRIVKEVSGKDPGATANASVLAPDGFYPLLSVVAGIEVRTEVRLPKGQIATSIVGAVTQNQDSVFVLYRRELSSPELLSSVSLNKLGVLALRRRDDAWRVVNPGGAGDFVILGTLATLGAGPEKSNDKSPDLDAAEQEIALTMGRWREAKIKRDLPALARLMTPDFVEINQNGDRLTRQQVLALYGTSDLSFKKIEVGNADLQVFGEAARATGDHIEQVTFRGREVGGHLNFAEVYVKTRDSWQIQSSRLKAFATTETVTAPEPSPGSIELVSLAPQSGSGIGKDTTVNAELSYAVEQFEPGFFLVMADFATTKPGISTMGVGVPVKQPILIRPKGRVSLAYPIAAVWDDKDVKAPFELRFCLQQLIGMLGMSRTVACTRPVTLQRSPATK
jgi:ketosteroid isomerase-like protein